MKFMRSALAAALIFSCVALSAETNPFGVTNPFEIGGTGGGGGGVTKFFGSISERDAYFQTNDRELRNGVTAAIGDPAVVYMWNGTAWVEAANTFIGAKGDTGSQGIQGIPGNDGADGEAATLTIGTVNTLAPTEAATVENVGTDTDAVLVLGIPQGFRGQPGPRGLTGEAAVANVRYRGEWVETDEYILNDIAVGADGSAYVALDVSTGVEPSTDTTGSWALYVSQGPQGEPGSEGIQGPMGPAGPQGPEGAMGKIIAGSFMPDYEKLTIVLDDTVNSPLVPVIPQGTTGTFTGLGEEYTANEDGYYIVYLRVDLAEAYDVGTGTGAALYMGLAVNGTIIGNSLPLAVTTGGERYRWSHSVEVKKGDKIQIYLRVERTQDFSFDSTTTYWVYIPYRSNVLPEVEQAFNDHISDTDIHLSLLDRVAIYRPWPAETDPVYQNDKTTTMQLSNIVVSGTTTLNNAEVSGTLRVDTVPVSDKDVTNKDYVDEAITQAVSGFSNDQINGIIDGVQSIIVEVATLDGRVTTLEQGGGTGTETDPVYTADKAGTMQLGDVEIAGSLTLGQPPLSPAEAANKAYVDSAIGSATQDVADNYAVKPDSRAGYVMPPKVFDYADSNTFTVDVAPKFVLEAMILRPDSFTYMQQSDISFSGTSVTLNNVTINSGDKVKITYAIQ